MWGWVLDHAGPIGVALTVTAGLLYRWAARRFPDVDVHVEPLPWVDRPSSEARAPWYPVPPTFSGPAVKGFAKKGRSDAA
jgi:hypothetical protein